MYPVRSLSKTERKQEMIKKYSEEKRLEVINARKDGATIAQITAQTGVGRTTVKAWGTGHTERKRSASYRNEMACRGVMK